MQRKMRHFPNWTPPPLFRAGGRRAIARLGESFACVWRGFEQPRRRFLIGGGVPPRRSRVLPLKIRRLPPPKGARRVPGGATPPAKKPPPCFSGLCSSCPPPA